MEVVSDCGLPVASLVWRPTAVSWMLTVVCKGTFVRKGAELVLAERQEPPTPADAHWDDDRQRSLRAATDLVPSKPRVDVVLVGQAYAPPGTAVRRLTARLAVAEIDKVIEIVADPQSSASFDRMPLVYERAAASPALNPVGVLESGAANLRLVRSSLAKKDAVAAFGPVSPSWPWRHSRRGSFSPGGFDFRAQPLPPDLDTSHFNHAPPDQQLERLPPHTRFVLENLDRNAPRVEFELPALRPWLVIERGGTYVEGETAEELPLMRCDTVTIDTDRAIISLTWRIQVPLDGLDDAGRAIVSLDPLRSSRVAAAAQKRPSPPPPPWPPPSVTGLPFRKPAPGDVPAPPPSWAPPAPPPSAAPTGSVRMPRNTAQLSAPPSAPLPAPMPPPSWSAPNAAPPIPPAESVGPASPSSPWSRPSVGGSVIPPALLAQPRPSGEPLAASIPLEPAKRPAALERGEVLQLLWFDPSILPRARRQPELADALEPLERRPREPELEDAFEERGPADVEDRRDVFEILSQAPATTDDRWASALSAATLAGGRFVPSIVLASGELALAFDELALLKATLSVATPLVGADEGLKRAIQDARDFLALPDLVSPAAVVDGFTTRICEAFRKLKRGHPANYLESHAERALTERRQYQKREVFGAQHLRATLHRGGGGRPIPTFLPEALATKLPLHARLRVRVLAELHLPEDPLDTHEATLKVVALGRVALVGPEAKPTAR